MRRTQLYLDEGLWKALQIAAKQSGSTISELVRTAVREKYVSPRKDRARILESAIGLWADRTDLPDTETYVRNLRRDRRSSPPS